ncbi:MAG TPA: hypothetical protein ENJ64_07575, partial [Thiotrichales bacterium]|nr:hypothetical protein [Thiotrichales bacterium]
IMGSVPSLLALLISLPDFARCTSLKRVVAGGEILNADFQARFFKCSQAELINIYGPTETSISVLQWRCQRKADSSRVPIGFPVAGMSIHLLDENMKPVGKGEKGEICIAGAGVAHGYHARETLTQERFIDSPEGQRLYRTGDLARQRADGAYEYLGRLDNQVKIRGQRVEPEEVEHVLRQCPSIEDGVVAARQSPTGAIELVAWYRAKTGADPDSSEIRRCMETILPAHMIPALFVPLAQLPLNPNGKIDRQALQVPAMAGATGNKLNKTQELVQSIWHEVLGYDVPGIDDNFFECGGNSLACLDLSVRIEKATGVRLSLSLLYEYSTIRVQAQRLDDCETADRIAYLSRETTGTNGTPLLLVSAIGGNLARVSGLGNYLTQYNVSAISSPVYASSPAIIADITDAQLATLQDNGLPEKIVLAGFSVGGLIAFELARKLTKKGVDVSQVILIDTATPVVIKKYLQQSGTFTGRLKALFRTVRERGINATIYLFLETLRKRRYASRLVKTYSPDIAEIMQTRKSQLLDVGIKAAMQYQPSSYDGDICLIRARDQIMFENDNASWGWKQHINGSLTCKNIAGSHSSLLREPNIRQVAAIIEHCL